MDTFMRESDAFSWYMERDPVLCSTVIAIAWLEKSPDWDVLKAKVEQTTRVVPMFRKRVIDVPRWLGTPRWLVDDAFDLNWHLRRVEAPALRTMVAVAEFAAHQATIPFDHARPLWEFTLIEHLEHDEAALVMKLHHALTDGIGGMELALQLFTTRREIVLDTELPPRPSNEQLDLPTLVRESVARNARQVGSFLERRMQAALPSAIHAATHPASSLGDALATWRSIGRTIAPIRETLSPIMRGRGIGRRFDILEVDLEDMKRAAASAGGTINDGFLAAVAGGLRLYHEHHGCPVQELRVTLPISIRQPDDPIGGNRITLMRFAVPISNRQPKDRIADSHRLCHAARDERSLAFTNAIAGTLNLLPAGFVRSMLKRVDFLTSDVPGFPIPVYLATARLERFVAFGPTVGAAVNILLLSYNGTCEIGVSMDTLAIDDPKTFVTCLRRGFEEVLSLSGRHNPVRSPLSTRAASPSKTVSSTSTPGSSTSTIATAD